MRGENSRIETNPNGGNGTKHIDNLQLQTHENVDLGKAN